MKLIGLTGLARAGKDTAAEFILEWAAEQEIIAKREAFADRLKISACALFDGPAHRAVEWCDALKTNGEITVAVTSPSGLREVEGYTGREFLQRYGTEAHREVFGTDFWVDALMTNLPDVDLVVVTDVRFPNEAAAINQLGEVWEITRDKAGLSGGLENHASEAGVEDGQIEFSIQNNGTLLELRRRIRQACEFNCKED